MKKQFLIFSLALILLIAISSVSAIDVTTCQEFQDINNTVGSPINGEWNLLNDIDCGGIASFTQISGGGSYFNGTFNGNGFKISNLNSIGGGLYRSVFGRIQEGGIVNDVFFDNVTITSSVGVVGCVAGANYGTINNVSCSGNITGTTSVGGLVGEQYADWFGSGFDKGFIFNSHFTGVVRGLGASYIGGIVGYSDGKVENSSAIADIYADAAGTNYVGGITGESYYDGFGSSYAEITNSYFSGNIFASDDDYVGGISGDFYGFIVNSFSEGTITGNDYVGGITGYQYSDFAGNSTITNSYSTADITGNDRVGGIVGELDQQSILTNVYANGVITASTNVGGVLGSLVDGECVDSFWDTETTTQATSACGTGKTTAQLALSATYTNWDIGQCVEGVSPSNLFTQLDYACLTEYDPSCTCPQPGSSAGEGVLAVCSESDLAWTDAAALAGLIMIILLVGLVLGTLVLSVTGIIDIGAIGETISLENAPSIIVVVGITFLVIATMSFLIAGNVCTAFGV